MTRHWKTETDDSGLEWLAKAGSFVMDAGVIFGTGFPPFRGGPLNYARERGADEVVRTLERLAGSLGERFVPHEAWSAL